MIRKNAEIEAANKKAGEANAIIGRTFKAGNEALNAKNYEEAIKQYGEGLAADQDQPALLTNRAQAFKARGVERFNAGLQSKDQASMDAGKQDFRDAADASTKAVELLKKEPAGADAEAQAKQKANKYVAFLTRAESMRLFVTKVDPTQADAGLAAFQDYIAVETDPAKKAKAQLDSAQMLLDAGEGDKSLAEFRKILATNPDDPDANVGAGLALFSTGDKAKYQDAANYLQHFVDVAPETHKFKADAKAILNELKNTEKVEPVRSTPSRRRRP
jgi:tetratricopeptide (TPR) repeat protein